MRVLVGGQIVLPGGGSCNFVSGVDCLVSQDYLSQYLQQSFNYTQPLQFVSVVDGVNTWTAVPSALPVSTFGITYAENATTRFPLWLSVGFKQSGSGVAVNTTVRYAGFSDDVPPAYLPLFEVPTNCTEV